MNRMPQISARELIKFLKSQGFKEDRQSGSHLTMCNEDAKVSVTIPIHGYGDLSRGLTIRILKDAGFTIDDFLEKR